MGYAIVSGFWADPGGRPEALCQPYDPYEFWEVWIENTHRYADPEYVEIVNSGAKMPEHAEFAARWTNLDRNPGHAEERLQQFCGHTVSWMSGFMHAYGNGVDVFYKEQDCLAFGDWTHEIIRASKGASVGLGFGPWRCDACLFFVEHAYIPEFIRLYLDAGRTGGWFPSYRYDMDIGEVRFRHASRAFDWVGSIPFGVGRSRPLPVDDPVWYAQKLVAKELDVLRERKMT